MGASDSPLLAYRTIAITALGRHEVKESSGQMSIAVILLYQVQEWERATAAAAEPMAWVLVAGTGLLAPQVRWGASRIALPRSHRCERRGGNANDIRRRSPGPWAPSP